MADPPADPDAGEDTRTPRWVKVSVLLETLSSSLKVDLRHPALFLFAAFLAAIPLHDARGQQPAEWRTDFRRHTVPLSEIVSGGPPKDGIPALSRPRLETVASADGWLAAREPVMVVEHDGVARAYPLQILLWHEIVNDDLGNFPIAVTFCSLCNTALVFDRRHKGRVLEFGTTGRLRHSDLVMYDKLTESWWQQATGEAIVGVMAGDVLTQVESQTMAWSDFRRAYPTAQVLSRQRARPEHQGNLRPRNRIRLWPPQQKNLAPQSEA